MDNDLEQITTLISKITDYIELYIQDERIKYNKWQFGSTGEYIVPFKNKKYKIIVQDNVLKDPLYINVITSWEEIN